MPNMNDVRWRPRRQPYLQTQIPQSTGVKVATLAANATTRTLIGRPPHPCVLDRCSAIAATVPADADGAILAYLKKWDKSAAAFVTLTGALSLEALAANEIELLPTLGTADLFFDEGDGAVIDVVNDSAAINTQPVDLTFVATWFLKWETRL